MKIDKIEIQNFFSIKNAEIEFDKFGGLVLVSGKNKDAGGSNGSGKSAVFEAVVWGLFGRTIRKGTEESIVNNKAKKNLFVRLILDDGRVEIIRKKRPTFLELHIDGENVTGASVSETQKRLEDHLRTNYTIFMASMAFGQHNSVEFISATPDDKRKIIRNFLNLSDLFDKRDKIRGVKAKYSTKVKESDAAIKELNDSKSSIESKLKKIKEERGQVLKDHNLKKEDLDDWDLERILEHEAGVQKLANKLYELQRELGDIQSKIHDLNDLITKGAHETKKRCGKCGTLILSEVTESDIKSFEEQLTKYLVQEGGLLVDIDANTFVYNINTGVKAPPVPSTEYQKIIDWKNLKTQEGHFNEELERIQGRLDELSEERKESATGYEVMRFWELAFSEQGMIKFVIRNVLDYFNDKVNYYLSYLSNSQYTVSFNDMLEETVKINGRKTMYISLSGGERRKINLAVLLALHSLLALTHQSQSDILFFDEVAEHLDAQSMTNLYTLLQELKKNKTIFIVTHDKVLLSLLENNKSIDVVKVKGESKITCHY